ncbi:flagellar filament capping protein FliD [Glaciibacter sp. 2TAF33]|uniref:flagellar filament capping protein FliD n=1 Tax=Glaciibacter sp. 2TAF33 TaxID=3233015 RepID=UPI003F931D59
MGLAVDGLVSGLDTTALINSLMQVEGVPQTLLKNKVSASQTLISALQGLNTKVAALADLALKTSKPAALDLYSARSSSASVTVTAATGAAPGQIDLKVDALAKSQKSVSDAMATWPDSPAVLTIASTDGTLHEITATSSSLDDVVSAVNTAGAGVTATKVAVGSGNYRIQFASTGIGADSAFTVYRGTSAEVTAATAPAMNLTQIQDAQDASITIWAGTPAAQTITSSSNTFSDLLPGVSISVSATSADPVSISIARDDAAISKKASDLVTALNGIFSEVSSKSTVTTSTDASGTTSTKGGVFTGDSTVRDVNQRVLSAASLPVNGRSPSEFGISISKTGTIDFDSARFATALAADPAATQATLTEIASRVAAAAASVSDKYSGSLTTKITGQESEVKGLGLQIDDWDRRLTTRRKTLEATYSALEVQLSKLNSQSSYLTSQLAGLPSASK